MALESAVRQRLISENPASPELVERPKGAQPVFEAWDPHEVTVFLEQVRGDRFEAAWRLTACGLRRSEVLGLTWGAVDFELGLIAVRQGRTTRKDGKDGLERTVVDVPKSRNSDRQIPIPTEVLESLRGFLQVQEVEAGLLGVEIRPSSFVVVDESLRPISPEHYSKMFHRHRQSAGLRRIRLHDMRRTAATLLHTEFGVPADSAASYLGHDPVTYHRTYVVGSKAHVQVSDALGRLQTAMAEGGLDGGKRVSVEPCAREAFEPRQSAAEEGTSGR
jgi:integrase